MKLFNELIRATKILANYKGQWAICGGVAASIYRSKPRFTNDIDFALIDSPQISAEQLASKVIKELGLKEYKGFIPNPLNSHEQILGLVASRGENDQSFVGFDFLLPIQFWVENAVKLAQSNQIDYGFDMLPTITPECLVLAKVVAVNSNPERYQDLDDIKEILASNKIDLPYLKQQILNCGILINGELLSKIFKND